MTRRSSKEAMRVVSAIAVFFIIIGFSSTTFAQKRLVVATWGGSWGESLRKNVAEPFEKKYNCKVDFSEGVSSDQVAKCRAQRANPQLDVVMVTCDSAALLAEQKLTVPLTPDKVPNLKNVYSVAIGKDNSYVAMYAYDIDIVWRSDKLNIDIQNWSDLWKVDMKKRFGVPYPGWDGMRFLLTVAHVFGGSEYNIEPGFAKLKELKPQFGRMWKGDAEQHQLLSSAEIWVTPMNNGDIWQLLEKGVPLKFSRPKDALPALYDTLNVVKNCPNPDLAFKFVDWALNEASQRGHCETNFIIPMNKNVKLKPEVAKKLPTIDELQKLLNFDDQQVNKMKDQWTERYNKEVLNF
jgi:putative spermidine/putrescine transport system substrate-binding protein